MAVTFDLVGQTALVTGASRGIGRAIADALAAAGARVVGTATSEGGAAGITADLGARHPGCRGAVLDVTRADSVAARLADLDSRGEQPDILVNSPIVNS